MKPGAARICAAALCATAFSISAVRAAEASSPVLSDRELAEVRGGYLSSNGLTFGFGATVSTFVDGTLALESHLTVTDAGVSRSQTAGAPLDAAAAQSAALAGLTGQGVVVGGDGGASTIIHNLSGNQILALVINSANNRMITQNTAVTLTLPRFGQLQQNAATQQLSASLLGAVGVGAVGSLRH